MKYDVPSQSVWWLLGNQITPKTMCPAWDACFFKRLRCFFWCPWHSPPSLQKTFGAGWFHTTSENETCFVSMHHKFIEFITHKTYENNWKYEFLLNQHTYYSYTYYMIIFLYNISYMQSGAGYLHHYRTSPPKKGSSRNPVLRRRWPPWSGPLALSRWPNDVKRTGRDHLSPVSKRDKCSHQIRSYVINIR